MQLEIEWSKAIPLRAARDGLIYTVDFEKFRRDSGVYVFARRWGSSYEALYVGKAHNVRARLKSQLNNLKLMRHVESAKTGNRVVLAGYARTKRGQQMSKVLPLLERALIRHFLSEGHDLVNKQGTRIRRHEINSSGAPRRLLAASIYLERGRGE